MKSKFFFMVLVLVLVSYTFAQVPQMMSYQGKLTDALGAPLNDTLVIFFYIYMDSTGGTPLWTEAHEQVIVDKGMFDLLLGSVNPIPFSVFDGSIRYLGVKVGADPEMTPRKPMVSVPYAFKSGSGGGSDNDWIFRVTDGADTTLITGGRWGIARYGNVLLGNADSTHVNLGVACTTGINGLSKKYCTTGGGFRNVASGQSTTVGGGLENSARGDWATIGGGHNNNASEYVATISGGGYNTASGQHSTVGGGWSNVANGLDATVGGGYFNTGSAYLTTVGGGRNNTASDSAATIGGGRSNYATREYTTIGGGYNNFAIGYASTVPGGYQDSASGDYSFAGGLDVTVKPLADYTFAFGKGFSTYTRSAVIFYHYGDTTKVGINMTNPSYAIHLPNYSDARGRGMANAWNTYSSIRWKENVNQIDHALDKVLAMRGVYFDWKESQKRDIGLIAEEVGKVIPEVVTYEKNGVDAEGMDYARLTALLVEAIKEQQQTINQQQQAIQKHKEEIESLKVKLEKLESTK